MRIKGAEYNYVKKKKKREITNVKIKTNQRRMTENINTKTDPVC